MTHDLTFICHLRIGPARHQLRAICSCGQRDYSTTADTEPKGQKNIRSQHANHVKNARAACHTPSSAGS